MKFWYNINFTLPKQSERSRSVFQDGSRSLGLFWKESNLSYNQRNTVCNHRVVTVFVGHTCVRYHFCVLWLIRYMDYRHKKYCQDSTFWQPDQICPSLFYIYIFVLYLRTGWFDQDILYCSILNPLHQSRLQKTTFLYYFSEKIRLYISCESCLAEDSHETSILIFLKDESKKIKVSSATIFVWPFKGYSQLLGWSTSILYGSEFIFSL